jgi:hypothetical protein
VAFGGQVHNGADPMTLKQIPDQFCVADIALYELMAGISSDLGQTREIPRVGQLIEVNNGVRK